MKKLLPEYEPPNELWSKIASQLDRDVWDKLPQYEPSEDVWHGTSMKLTPKKHRFRWAPVAVSIVLAVGICALYFADNERLIYRTQVIDDALLLNEFDAEEQDDFVDEFCKQKMLLCESEDFKNLKKELDELNSASNELKSAMGNYNTEPELMRQLKEIENSKSAILRAMASKI